MKKITLALTLLATFLMIGCESKIEKIMKLAERRKIQVCTKGVSSACDSKTNIYLNEVSTTPVAYNYSKATPTSIENHTVVTPNGAVLYVNTGNREGMYIGAVGDWDQLWTDLQAIKNDAQKDHALTLFFQDMFDTYGFVKQHSYTDPETKVITYTYTDTHGAPFSETSVSRKDLEGMGAGIEAVRNEGLANRLVATYGLSTERATSVAKNLSTYNKLATKRALTAKEKNFFAKELLGVNFEAAQNAIVSGDKKDMDNLLETAADVNETSPEQVSAIITEMFL